MGTRAFLGIGQKVLESNVIESGGTPAPFDPVSRIAHPTASGPAVRANGIGSTALTDRACGRAYCVRGVYHCQ